MRLRDLPALAHVAARRSRCGKQCQTDRNARRLRANLGRTDFARATSAGPPVRNQEAQARQRKHDMQIELVPFRPRRSGLDEDQPQQRLPAAINNQPARDDKLPVRSNRKNAGISKTAASTPPDACSNTTPHRRCWVAERYRGRPPRWRERHQPGRAYADKSGCWHFPQGS